MRNMIVLIVDTAQIQPYIFGSNRLRENIGASHLVAQVTGRWAYKAVWEATQGHCNFSESTHTLNIAWHIEDEMARYPNGCAEVIYAGGGNFIVLFSRRDESIAFTSALSEVAITDAPGLQLVIASEPFDWDAGNQALQDAMTRTFRQLNAAKRARRTSVPLLGLGVTVMCQSTSMPAVGLTPPIKDEVGAEDPASIYPASAEILAKVASADGANHSLRNAFSRELAGNNGLFDFPRDFDELGRTLHEDSHIALVHADGNAMGQCIQDISGLSSTNRTYISNLRRFSELVKLVAHDSLRDTVNELRQRVEPNHHAIVYEAGGKQINRIELVSRTIDGKLRWMLPLRPIVFGGDDVSLVCDGRLGLSIAAEYLHEFEANAAVRIRQVFDMDTDAPIVDVLKRPGNFTACAGVAIVKTHFPFARAYDLAESLCTSAKKERAKDDLKESCIDWHLAMSGVSGDLKEIRHREYTALKPGDLTLRPVTIGANPMTTYRSWPAIEQCIIAFQSGPEWAQRHNKVKALRVALRGGEIAVQRFLSKYNEGNPLPELAGSAANWTTTGWQDGVCGYFDAVELVDLYMPLIVDQPQLMNAAVEA